MNYLTPISIFIASLALLGACSLDPKEESCAPETECVACLDPQADVGAVLLEVAVSPDPGFNQTTAIDAVCVIEERLSSDVQDGLVLGCQTDSGPVQLRIQYSNGQLVLPDSVTVGLEVRARYVAIENEMRGYAVIVREVADDHVILAVHKGPDVVAYQEGVGSIAGFWAPIEVESVMTTCEATPATCDGQVRRGALQFTAEGEAVVLSDHQVGKVGPYGVHVGSVIDSVSSGTGCDGGTNATHDFLIVHSPA